MGTTSPQSGDLALRSPSDVTVRSGENDDKSLQLSESLLNELWRTAGADDIELSRSEFLAKLLQVGRKHNCNLEAEKLPSASEAASFFRGLHLSDLALAHACALGRNAAWQVFMARYKAGLLQTALAIAYSATVAHDLAESLYSDLYGLNERDGKRRSPLESYAGRGPLIGWLRTALVQKHANHQRRVRREMPLEMQDVPVFPTAGNISSAIGDVQSAVVKTLSALSANDRFLLVAYFLDRRTLAQIGQLLQVHEATVSRKLKVLTKVLRKRLIQELQSTGFSKRAAEEALAVDPRDLMIDVRRLLQSLPAETFIDQEVTSEQPL